MTDLPDGIDPAVWFTSERCGGRDYIFDAHWLTHRGRLAAFCPHDAEHPNYRISKSELPAELPEATRYFVAGFLAGNLPDPPFDEDDDAVTMLEWERAARSFAETGSWRIDVDLQDPWRRREAEMFADARALALIGAGLTDQCQPIDVTLPDDLADVAADAWARTAFTIGARKDQIVRERAAALAFIGSHVADGGTRTDGGMTVSLPVDLIGEAIKAVNEGW